MMMVVVLRSSWVAMRVQWMDVMAVLRCAWWAKLLPFHFDECASPVESNNMSRSCGELYWVSVIGHVRGEEQYECVTLYVSIRA